MKNLRPILFFDIVWRFFFALSLSRCKFLLFFVFVVQFSAFSSAVCVCISSLSQKYTRFNNSWYSCIFSSRRTPLSALVFPTLCRFSWLSHTLVASLIFRSNFPPAFPRFVVVGSSHRCYWGRKIFRTQKYF